MEHLLATEQVTSLNGREMSPGLPSFPLPGGGRACECSWPDSIPRWPHPNRPGKGLGSPKLVRVRSSRPDARPVPRARRLAQAAGVDLPGADPVSVARGPGTTGGDDPQSHRTSRAMTPSFQTSSPAPGFPPLKRKCGRSLPLHCRGLQ